MVLTIEQITDHITKKIDEVEALRLSNARTSKDFLIAAIYTAQKNELEELLEWIDKESGAVSRGGE